MAVNLNTTLLLRRGEFADSFVLKSGEPGYHTGTKELKIGDGTTTWGALGFANKAQIEALIKVVDDKVAALDNTYATDAELEAVRAALQGAIDGISGRVQTIETAIAEGGSVATAIAAADEKAQGAQDAVDTLAEYVGEFTATEGVSTIVGYINKKTEGIATDANLAILEGRIATIENAPYATEAGVDQVVGALAEGAVANNTAAIVAINNEDSGILAQAKSYVDTEDVFHTDILTVNALGGIAAGANLNNMTTHEILNTLLFPYVAFTINSSSRSASAATLENGATQTLSSATISVTKKSKPIQSITLYNGSTVLETKTGDAVANGGSITFNGFDAITVSKSNNPNLKFTVTDGTTSTDKNVGASTFVYPYYWGECAADATIDESLVESLTKKVESKGAKTVTHTCENGRMVIAYPKSHGVLKSILDPNNFETIGDYTRSEVSVTGLDGTAQTYYVYASGAATVSGFKVQYKY